MATPAKRVKAVVRSRINSTWSSTPPVDDDVPVLPEDADADGDDPEDEDEEEEDDDEEDPSEGAPSPHQCSESAFLPIS